MYVYYICICIYITYESNIIYIHTYIYIYNTWRTLRLCMSWSSSFIQRATLSASCNCFNLSDFSPSLPKRAASSPKSTLYILYILLYNYIYYIHILYILYMLYLLYTRPVNIHQYMNTLRNAPHLVRLRSLLPEPNHP